MLSNLSSRVIGIGLLSSALIVTASADELAVKGRDILEKNKQSVVSVQVVLNMSYSGGGGGSETKQELTGTVVDASGLTVLALSACDPSEMYSRLSDDSRARLQTEVTDIKILLEDGTELSAEIILRDKELDLAFIRPKAKPATAMVPVDLNKSSPAQALDQVVALHRLNSAAGRACAAAAERVGAVIKKPRTFYIPESSMTATTPGAPAFSLDGNLVGIFVMRTVSGKGGTRNFRNNMTAIILPAGDILKAAKQAPEPKGDS